MPPVSFDESLPRFVDVLVEKGFAAALANCVILRDATGQLAFFADSALDERTRESLAEALKAAVDPYVRTDRPVIDRDAPGAQRIFADPTARARSVNDHTFRFVDRRIVGSDWLRSPVAVIGQPTRFVFASLKGGVGRSTAISVVAAEASRLGRNVLVLDLDLEAPGVGGMLLTPDRLPLLGTLDYLVARNFGPYTRSLDELVGTSTLTSGAGLVDVVPVTGRSSIAAPENVLAKLARGVVEGTDAQGAPLTLAGKLTSLLSELEARRSYDIVLIDARAGLAELAAAPLLELGANVFLFGTSQRQTLEGFRYLFAHLATLVGPEQDSPWGALKMVHAKAGTVESMQKYREALWELFSLYLYEEQEGYEGLNFEPDDPVAPHHPVVIPNDFAFADWDPTDDSSTLVTTYYDRTYRDLLNFVVERCEWSVP